METSAIAQLVGGRSKARVRVVGIPACEEIGDAEGVSEREVVESGGSVVDDNLVRVSHACYGTGGERRRGRQEKRGRKI